MKTRKRGRKDVIGRELKKEGELCMIGKREREKEREGGERKRERGEGEKEREIGRGKVSVEEISMT